MQTIRDYLDTQTTNNCTKILLQNVPHFETELTELKSLNEDEVKKIILKSPNKFCELDPIPTNLLKECIDEILQLLTHIINISIQLDDVPASLKQAIITP